MIDEKAVPLPTVYPSSKRRVVLLLLVSMAFVALGVVLLAGHGSVKAVVAGAVSVPFFGLCAGMYATRLARGRPELTLDVTGLEHVQLGRIAWSEIAAVRIRELTVRSANQLIIELVLHDPAGYLARAPRIVRMTARANRGLGFGPANLSANTLPVGPEAVVVAMVRHHPQLAVQR